MSFSVEASNTVAVVEKLASDTVNALKPLADELGMAAKYVFELFVRQNYVHATQSILWALFLFGLAIFFYKWQKNTRAKEDFDWDDGYSPSIEGVGVALAIVGIFLCVGLGSSAIINDAAPRLINPHYYAIQDMVEMGNDLISDATTE